MAEGGLYTLTATQASAELAKGSISAEELTSACLERIEAVDKDIRAFVHLDREHALRQARELDQRRRNGHTTGPLHGIPVAVKDIVDTVDYPTECGSPLFSGRRPTKDATIVSKLRSAGAVIIGKTVTTECAFYHPGPTRNPHDLGRTPGGSSSGSAAAVAAAMAPLAIGSQTNGSVIRPASFCGVYGMKPSHGLVSRGGVLPLSRALDHMGPFARTLEDLALIMDVIAGYDPRDPDTRAVAAPAHSRILGEPPPLPPRFAFMRTPIWDNKITPDAKAAFETLVRELGDRVDTCDLPERFAGAWNVQRTIMVADMAHSLSAIVERGSDKSSAVLRETLAEGRQVTAVDYLKALDEARFLGRVLEDYFDMYDAIITPATTGVAPKGLSATGDPAFCSLWTLVGFPSVTLPLLKGENDLPIGVQLVAMKDDDARLLRTARALLGMLAE